MIKINDKTIRVDVNSLLKKKIQLTSSDDFPSFFRNNKG